jgi:hypothetical protein
MIKQNVTFTCRTDGTDKTEQRTVTMGYCYATEIAFKDLAGQDISDFLTEALPLIQDNKMPDIKKTIYAILSCMIAYYQSMDEEPPVKDTDLMNEATPLEIGTALGTFLTLRANFYHIPNGEPAEKPAKGRGKAKN